MSLKKSKSLHSHAILVLTDLYTVTEGWYDIRNIVQKLAATCWYTLRQKQQRHILQELKMIPFMYKMKDFFYIYL